MKERIFSLDVLRGVAIALVLACHFPYFDLLYRLGGSGVTLFFVLSGFLISGILFREYQETGIIRTGRFLLRRALKIWPSAYLYLGVIAFLITQFRPPKPWGSLALSASFLSNYCSANCAGIVGHTWSLAVEEHFYLTLPFLLVVLIRRDRLSWIPAFCGVLIALCFIFRYLEPGDGAYQKTHCRIDSLFIGVTLGYFHSFRKAWFERIARSWNLVPALSLVATWMWPNVQFAKTVGLLMVPLGYAVIVAWAVEHEPKRKTSKLLLAPLARLGVYSYCVYLWQQVFASLVYHQTHLSFLAFVGLVGGSIGTGIIMAKLVEIPVLRLRDKVLPALRRVPTPVHRDIAVKQLKELPEAS